MRINVILFFVFLSLNLVAEADDTCRSWDGNQLLLLNYTEDSVAIDGKYNNGQMGFDGYDTSCFTRAGNYYSLTTKTLNPASSSNNPASMRVSIERNDDKHMYGVVTVTFNGVKSTFSVGPRYGKGGPAGRCEDTKICPGVSTFTVGGRLLYNVGPPPASVTLPITNDVPSNYNGVMEILNKEGDACTNFCSKDTGGNSLTCAKLGECSLTTTKKCWTQEKLNNRSEHCCTLNTAGSEYCAAPGTGLTCVDTEPCSTQPQTKGKCGPPKQSKYDTDCPCNEYCRNNVPDSEIKNVCRVKTGADCSKSVCLPPATAAVDSQQSFSSATKCQCSKVCNTLDIGGWTTDNFCRSDGYCIDRNAFESKPICWDYSLSIWPHGHYYPQSPFLTAATDMYLYAPAMKGEPTYDLTRRSIGNYDCKAYGLNYCLIFKDLTKDGLCSDNNDIEGRCGHACQKDEDCQLQTIGVNNCTSCLKDSDGTSSTCQIPKNFNPNTNTYSCITNQDCYRGYTGGAGQECIYNQCVGCDRQLATTPLDSALDRVSLCRRYDNCATEIPINYRIEKNEVFFYKNILLEAEVYNAANCDSDKIKFISNIIKQGTDLYFKNYDDLLSSGSKILIEKDKANKALVWHETDYAATNFKCDVLFSKRTGFSCVLQDTNPNIWEIKHIVNGDSDENWQWLGTESCETIFSDAADDTGSYCGVILNAGSGCAECANQLGSTAFCKRVPGCSSCPYEKNAVKACLSETTVQAHLLTPTTDSNNEVITIPFTELYDTGFTWSQFNLNDTSFIHCQCINKTLSTEGIGYQYTCNKKIYNSCNTQCGSKMESDFYSNVMCKTKSNSVCDLKRFPLSSCQENLMNFETNLIPIYFQDIKNYIALNELKKEKLNAAKYSMIPIALKSSLTMGVKHKKIRNMIRTYKEQDNYELSCDNFFYKGKDMARSIGIVNHLINFRTLEEEKSWNKGKEIFNISAYDIVAGLQGFTRIYWDTGVVSNAHFPYINPYFNSWAPPMILNLLNKKTNLSPGDPYGNSLSCMFKFRIYKKISLPYWINARLNNVKEKKASIQGRWENGKLSTPKDCTGLKKDLNLCFNSNLPSDLMVQSIFIPNVYQSEIEEYSAASAASFLMKNYSNIDYNPFDNFNKMFLDHYAPIIIRPDDVYKQYSLLLSNSIMNHSVHDALRSRQPYNMKNTSMGSADFAYEAKSGIRRASDISLISDVSEMRFINPTWYKSSLGQSSEALLRDLVDMLSVSVMMTYRKEKYYERLSLYNAFLTSHTAHMTRSIDSESKKNIR